MVYVYREGTVARKMHRLKARPVGVKAPVQQNIDWLP